MDADNYEESPTEDQALETQFLAFDHEQQVRVDAIAMAHEHGRSMFGSMAGVGARNLIAIAYYIDTGIIPEELLINSIETVGNCTTEKYLTPPATRTVTDADAR